MSGVKGRDGNPIKKQFSTCNLLFGNHFAVKILAANFRVDTYLMNLLESPIAIVNFSTNGMKMYTELLIQIKTKNRSWIPN